MPKNRLGLIRPTNIDVCPDAIRGAHCIVWTSSPIQTLLQYIMPTRFGPSFGTIASISGVYTHFPEAIIRPRCQISNRVRFLALLRI